MNDPHAGAAGAFSYAELTTRNIGFITEAEQEVLRNARVLVTGVGGMGGAAVACLLRAGVGGFIIADIDVFEVSNLNRQIFANLDVVGKDKAMATRDAMLRVNPECEVEVVGASWTAHVGELLAKTDVAVNGCDDVRATLKMMRAARGTRTVIDAFASTLPNVYVVGPDDPRPEEVFGYPSVGIDVDRLSDDEVKGCARREIEWVMSSSSTADHVVMDRAIEMVAGKRKRMSFAPMVWMTGCLMAYEVVRVLLGKPGGAGVGGVFHNPWSHAVERPLPGVLGEAKRAATRSVLERLLRRAP